MYTYIYIYTHIYIHILMGQPRTFPWPRDSRRQAVRLLSCFVPPGEILVAAGDETQGPLFRGPLIISLRHYSHIQFSKMHICIYIYIYICCLYVYLSLYLSLSLSLYVYIYIYMHTYVYTYIYIEREREI